MKNSQQHSLVKLFSASLVLALLVIPLYASAVTNPDCSGDEVFAHDITFMGVSECFASTSLEMGPNVSIESEARVNLYAPIIALKPPFSIDKGASFTVTLMESAASIEFIGAKSATFSNIGDSKTFSVGVTDSFGSAIAGGHDDISWSVSSPSNYQLSSNTGNSIDVTALTTTIGGATLTATYTPLGISANAQILTAELQPLAVYIESDWVQQRSVNSEETLTLDNNSATKAIQPGDILYSDDIAGVLIKVTFVRIDTSTVTIIGIPASLTDLYERMSINEQSQSRTALINYDFDRQIVSVNGVELRDINQRSLLDSIECENTSGSDIGFKITGGSITFKPKVKVAVSSRIEGGTLESFSIMSIVESKITANTGKLSFSSTVGAGASCSLDLPQFTSPPVMIAPVGFSFQLSPSLGLDVSAQFSGPSFLIQGPRGYVIADNTAGICYEKITGWSGCSNSSLKANYQPPSAEFSTSVDFTLGVSPFGQLDIGLIAQLGIRPLAYTLADVRFAELKAEAPINFAFTSPFDPQHIDYTGPTWSIGTKVSGVYKTELGEGLLTDLIKRIDKDVALSLNITGNLFKPIENTILKSPMVTITGPKEIQVEYEHKFTIQTDIELNSGIYKVLKHNIDTDSKTYIGNSLTNGVGTYNWTPENIESELGINKLYPRVSVDLLSHTYPYASNSELDVRVIVDKCLDYIDTDTTRFVCRRASIPYNSMGIEVVRYIGDTIIDLKLINTSMEIEYYESYICNDHNIPYCLERYEGYNVFNRVFEDYWKEGVKYTRTTDRDNSVIHYEAIKEYIGDTENLTRQGIKSLDKDTSQWLYQYYEYIEGTYSSSESWAMIDAHLCKGNGTYFRDTVDLQSFLDCKTAAQDGANSLLPTYPGLLIPDW